METRNFQDLSGKVRNVANYTKKQLSISNGVGSSQEKTLGGGGQQPGAGEG